MKKSDLAAEYKRSRNCCQAVLSVYADELDMTEERMMALGAGFGSGMGGTQGTCGALCGAEMVLGLKSFSGSSLNRYSRALYDEFINRCGSAVCKELKGIESGRALCSCEDCVRNAVEILEEMV